MDISITEAVHESAKDLYEVNAIDLMTMRKFDSLCLPPVEKFSPQKIKRVRLLTKASQAVFAKLLNISTSTVKHWEAGDKHPSGSALKLLNIIKRRGIEAITV